MNSSSPHMIWCSFLALLPVSLTFAGGGESDASGDEAVVLSVERPGDGKPVCGLGKDFHAGRRKALRERVESGVMLFRGLHSNRANLAFRQDKTFWWLTGVESPNAALIMDADSGQEILFLPKPNPHTESWNGEIWDSDDAWVRELTGFEDVRKIDDLVDVLKEVLGERKTVKISKHPWIGMAGSYDAAGPYDKRRRKDVLDGRMNREEALEAKLQELLGVEVEDIKQDTIALRHVKTPEEIAALRRAGRAGALAMVEAIRSTRVGLGEWELEGVMSLAQMREGAQGPGYNAIVGSGANSCILHYNGSSRRMQAEEVVLIDYGPEVDHYVTDITRTWPVDGKFTKRARELYEAVLAAQEAGIAAARPGTSLREIGNVANGVLKERGFGDFIRHGVCHFIGMEVHDPGLYREPLVPGVAFTIEPGAYEDETGIGIRIEDVVVITADGCEVITDQCPKDPDELEALVASEGILDLLPPAGR